MDVKRIDGKFHVFTKGGREDTGMDAIEWAIQGEALGAGELVVNSIDTDGVKEGFDLELLDLIAEKTSLPIVASGGAGKMEDFAELFKHPGIDACLAASIFHRKEVNIMELKEYACRIRDCTARARPMASKRTERLIVGRLAHLARALH